MIHQRNRIDIRVYGDRPLECLKNFCSLANRVQSRFFFLASGRQGVGTLEITDELAEASFQADRSRGVLIAAKESERICRYLRVGQEDYFLVAGMLGLTQWVALVSNPLLIAEDFRDHPARGCLFAARKSIQDFVLSLEAPKVCAECLQMYCCLGAEPEVEALTLVLAHFRSLNQETAVPLPSFLSPLTVNKLRSLRNGHSRKLSGRS